MNKPPIVYMIPLCNALCCSLTELLGEEEKIITRRADQFSVNVCTILFENIYQEIKEIIEEREKNSLNYLNKLVRELNYHYGNVFLMLGKIEKK